MKASDTLIKPNSTAARPIILSSVFKSGTWLIRHILQQLTELEVVEPEMRAGRRMDPRDPELVFSKPGSFYSWHFIPEVPVCDKLSELQALPVFLMRNIYDLVVSMYFHFYNNIDADIGRGAEKHEYFSSLTRDQGLQKIILGSDDGLFRWQGIGLHLKHIERMFVCASKQHAFLVSYEKLVREKAQQIRLLADFLDIPVTQETIDRIAESSSFNNMKQAALQKKQGSHFRKGESGNHKSILTDSHIRMMRQVMAEQTPNLEMLASKAGFPEVTDSG